MSALTTLIEPRLARPPGGLALQWPDVAQAALSLARGDAPEPQLDRVH